jgi:hypothetical protein
MLRSAPLKSPAMNPATAGVYLLGVCVAILSWIAGSLGAWAVGAAPQYVAHLLAILCLGCAASLLSLLAGTLGIFPRNFDRLALVTNSLTAGAGVAIFFTNAAQRSAGRARRRVWRMKP